ncbi:MAG: hypothetical protein K0R57_5911 [Paenibacillaceae bacterium]|nr:hypothetical protein [Paenibacillaceae bacterium]
MGTIQQAAGMEQLLRQHECLCFQAAYYLLGKEDEALAAAKLALLAIAREEGFMALPESLQRERVRHAAAVCSLHIRKNTMLAG